MSDNNPNIVLEHLIHIRATTDKTGAKVLELEKHLIELRLQVAGLVREDVLGKLAVNERLSAVVEHVAKEQHIASQGLTAYALRLEELNARVTRLEDAAADD